MNKQKNTDNTETCGGITTCAQEPSGVENKELDFDEAELKPCYPDEIRDRHTETNSKVVSSNPTPDPSSSETNKPSSGSGDPESGVLVSTEPKTARTWLKDPHLYKVITFFFLKTSFIFY